ncbi:MAG: hypothetical protein HQ567_21505 [Candidatus Nealsonbacteria bacterium]|nr:hypothetical protein [Candidatus Nealsonbacteria bacterium]
MEVARISAGYPGTTTSDRQAERPTARIEAAGQNGPAQGSVSTGTTAALGEILSRYDVTDITPTEFSEMVQELFEAGAITDKELQQLAAVRHDLEVDDMDPDDSLDLMEYYARKIKKVQSRREDTDGPDEQLGPLLGCLDWIEKFALVQSSPDTFGLDAMV